MHGDSHTALEVTRLEVAGKCVWGGYKGEGEPGKTKPLEGLVGTLL